MEIYQSLYSDSIIYSPFYNKHMVFQMGVAHLSFSQTVMLHYNSGFFVKEFDKIEEKLRSKEVDKYENHLEYYGVSKEEAKAKCEEIFNTLFFTEMTMNGYIIPSVLIWDMWKIRVTWMPGPKA